jgi:hypothetical protein
MTIEPKHIFLTMIGVEGDESVRHTIVVNSLDEAEITAFFIEEVFGGKAIVSLGSALETAEVMYITPACKELK